MTDRGLDRRSLAMIAAYGAVLLLALAASGKTLNYHEARYAQAAREMVDSGHWLIPTVGGDPRLQKPAFTYWVIAVVFEILGVGGFSARLPTALAALAGAILMAELAARHLGARVGVLTGLVQLSSIYTLVSGQLSDPDMLLALTVIAAVFSFASRSMLDFYAALGVSALVKGPIGGTFILPPCVALAFWQRGREGWRLFVHPLGIAVLFALVSIWPIAAYLSNGAVLDAWLEENVGRLRGDLGSDPALFYLYTVPWMVLPWLPFTIVGASTIWRERSREPLWILLAVWFVSGVFLLSLSAGKHARYLVPVLPALSPFTAVGVAKLEPAVRTALKGFDPARAFAVALGVFLVGALSTQVVATHGHFDGYRYNRELAERASAKVPADRELLLIAIPNNERIQLLFYLDRLPRTLATLEELRPAALRGPIYAIGPAKAAAAIGRAANVTILDEAAKPLKHHGREERLVLFEVDAS